MQFAAYHRHLVARTQQHRRGGEALAATGAQVIDTQVDGAELGQPRHALLAGQVLMFVEGADQRHGAAGDVEQRGDHPAVEDAVDEVADQLRLHRQVHGDALGAQFIELDTEHLVEGDALEEQADRLLQFCVEFKGLGHGFGPESG